MLMLASSFSMRPGSSSMRSRNTKHKNSNKKQSNTNNDKDAPGKVATKIRQSVHNLSVSQSTTSL